MKVALLIGFSYDSASTSLPGIVIDLYLAYRLAINSSPDRIMVITDVVEDRNTQLLLNAIISSLVDGSILSFIENIKQDGVYQQYLNRSQLMKTIKGILNSADQVFIYYTGHVKRGEIKLPVVKTVTLANEHVENDNGKLSLYDFRNLILSSVVPSAEIFLIMDCCNGSGLSLPFQLTSKSYRLTRCDQAIYPKPDIIYLTSTNLNERAVATIDGSLFSQSLFKEIRLGERSLTQLLQVLRQHHKSQTAMIYSNRPNIKFIWDWLFKDSSPVQIDLRNCIVTIKFQPAQPRQRYPEIIDT